MEFHTATISTTPLSPDEKLALELYEGVIHAGKLSVGVALAGIRDGRLYRETHPTFEEYCREKFNMTHRYANMKISAAASIKSLGTIGSQTPSERAVRPLTRLRKSDGTPDEDLQRKAWEEASELAKKVRKKVTAKRVKEAVDRINGIKKQGDHPELEVINASHAMWYAEIALTHLKRIEPDDPKKAEAAKMVIKWCKDNLLKEEG